MITAWSSCLRFFGHIPTVVWIFYQDMKYNTKKTTDFEKTWSLERASVSTLEIETF